MGAVRLAVVVAASARRGKEKDMQFPQFTRKIVSSVQPSTQTSTTTPSEQGHFAAIRTQIEQFDEEKKGALERLMVFLFTIAAYVGPFIVARSEERRVG